jgi:hypothetical protein
MEPKTPLAREIWGFNGDEDLTRGLLCRDAV